MTDNQPSQFMTLWESAAPRLVVVRETINIPEFLFLSDKTQGMVLSMLMMSHRSLLGVHPASVLPLPIRLVVAAEGILSMCSADEVHEATALSLRGDMPHLTRALMEEIQDFINTLGREAGWRPQLNHVRTCVFLASTACLANDHLHLVMPQDGTE